MATFVLCHGAWSGGFIWRRVADTLRAAGHEVFTPTYTGLGERSHLAGPGVDLETHIADVQGVIHWEGLEDFVLVGHSYGGMVITGVADREWHRIRRLVYLDAFLPGDNQSLDDLTGPARAAAMADLAERLGAGWRVPRPEGSISPKLPARDQAWLASLSAAQPRNCFTQKLRHEGNHLKIADRIYVLATDYPGTPFAQFAERTAAEGGWTNLELPTHHHLSVSMPEETAAILTEGLAS